MVKVTIPCWYNFGRVPDLEKPDHLNPVTEQSTAILSKFDIHSLMIIENGKWKMKNGK